MKNMHNKTIIQILSENLNNNNFYIKRDDLLPLSFGGNKVRKSVLFFDDINKTKSDCIVTYGSSSSNHCRVIANMAAAKKTPCYIISPSESNKSTYNKKMIKLFGAKVIECSVDDVKTTIDKKIDELKNSGYKPYFIEGGGHGNLGTQAYADAYKEILEYENQKNISFDYIFHASGTGTTQAGLVCGSIVNTDDKNIVGISIARINPYGRKVVLKSVNDYLGYKAKGIVDIKTINFIDDYVLDGYGYHNKAILETIKEVLKQEGIPLDTTYTGKAYWGMKEFIKKSCIENKNILFIHTGGTPLFFDNLEEL